jgi:Tfp pilus assembly protein PilV
MRLHRTVETRTTSYPQSRRREQGLSLVEMMVALGLGSIVLTILGLLSLNGLRCFLVMGNSFTLDQQNRVVAIQVARDLRQATRVLSYQSDSTSKRLVLTNSLEGVAVAYSWDTEARTLTCTKTGQPEFTCLTDCDFWEAKFFQNLPQPSVSEPFLPATNSVGDVDVNQARIVTLSWRCSRPLTGTSLNTESAKSLQILLRNSAQP